MLYRKIGWGLLAAGIVWIPTRSVFFALFMFAFVAGGAVCQAYWRSLDDKSGG